MVPYLFLHVLLERVADGTLPKDWHGFSVYVSSDVTGVDHNKRKKRKVSIRLRRPGHEGACNSLISSCFLLFPHSLLFGHTCLVRCCSQRAFAEGLARFLGWVC